MAAFSTLRHFGDNFGNRDVARQVSLFLNQRDKCAMCTSAKGVHLALKDQLPTSTRYITTVKPNLMSAFSFEKGVYSAPIETFQPNKDGNFGSFYQSMITHVGANEDKDFYSAWYECQLKLRPYEVRCRRGDIDHAIRRLTDNDQKLLVERLHESVDIRLTVRDGLGYACPEFNCPGSAFPKYIDDIKAAIVSNTSIVDLLVYSGRHPCQCALFECIATRSTDINSLQLRGDVRCDSVQHYMDCCVDGLKTLSITPPADFEKISGYTVDLMCQNVADVGILEILELGHVGVDPEDLDYDYENGHIVWTDGLIRVLETCPLSSLRIDHADFEQICLDGMVDVLPKLKAADVKMISCNFGNWGKPVFDALFANTTMRWLDLSYTKIGDESIGALVGMIKRGTLTQLAVGECGIGRDGIKSVPRATTHKDSKLSFISICGNDIHHTSVFGGMEETSLQVMHVGKLSDDVALVVNLGTVGKIDTRSMRECFMNDGEEVWPWMTKSDVWINTATHW